MDNKELVRKELVHLCSRLPIEDFFELIDQSGGWPVGWKYVSFFHDGPIGNRYCKFTNHELRTGWWTTICSSDDYYYWKLSDDKKQLLINQAKKDLIHKLSILEL